MGVLGTLFGGISGDIVEAILNQINKFLVKAYISLLEFVQQMILAVSSTPLGGDWQQGLQNNVTNLFLYAVVVVLIGMVIFGFTKQNKRADAGRAFLTLLISGAIAKYWFSGWDYIHNFGHSFAESLNGMFQNLDSSSSLANTFSLPDPITSVVGLFGLFIASGLLAIMSAAFPILFIFGKFTGLLFFCVRVISDKAQSAWDWVFGLLIISAILGPVVMITFIELGILAVKYMQLPGIPGALVNSYLSLFYSFASIVLAAVATIKLIRAAPRIASRLTGGAVRTVSEITGRVTSEVKNKLNLNSSNGLKAYAHSMRSRTTENQFRQQQAKHAARARLTGIATTGASAAAIALGQPEAVPFIKKTGGVLTDHHNRRAKRAGQKADKEKLRASR